MTEAGPPIPVPAAQRIRPPDEDREGRQEEQRGNAGHRGAEERLHGRDDDERRRQHDLDARERSLPADLDRWTRVRDQIFAWLMERGWSDSRGAFTQHDGTDVLDASVLLMPLVGFISPTDPRWLSTLDAIGEELVSDSLVFRYDPSASPDGLDGDEGTFTICSFWYVEALATAGRVREARLVFEKIPTHANHLALIRAAIALDERLG